MFNVRTAATFAAAMLLASLAQLVAAEPQVLNVWPGEAPGETGKIGPEEYQPERPGERKVARLTNVSQPTIAVYQPDEAKRTDVGVVICPGGGYRILAMDLEGTEVAEWFNSIGVTAFVLKYRVPARDEKSPHAVPLQDAQRAMSLVRSKAEEWKLDPRKIGILGFSAGGNLAGATCIRHAERKYAAIDAVDEVSCRPDFGVLVYPAYFIDDSGQLKAEFTPTKDTPPLFFAHAGDDRVKAENSIALYAGLKAAGVPGELHIYSAGGHGFGLRPSDFPASSWPQRCEAWLVQQKILVPKAPPAPPVVE
ncbi:MAG: alpha/beta hydrolase [Pirellulaceae bacterium]|jgi:acetyl esterase/lipase|nr:alpha/beta hydrolase [Pirellulaceae bacterium]